MAGNSSLPSGKPSARVKRVVPALLFPLGLAACVTGTDVAGPHDGSPIFLHLVTAFTGHEDQAGSLEGARFRIQAHDRASGRIVAFQEGDLDADASEWRFQLVIDPTGLGITRVEVTLEILTDIVEWSAVSPPIPVTIGTEPVEIRDLALLRGGFDNHPVTGIAITSLPDSVPEGRRLYLTASLQGGGPVARPFFRSLDPQVLEVSREGAMRALRPGLVRVEAMAGGVSDTRWVAVFPRPLGEATVQSVGIGLDDSISRLLPGLSDPAGAQAIAGGMAQLLTALDTRRPAEIQDAIVGVRAALAAYGDAVSRRRDGPELSLVELVLDYLEYSIAKDPA